MVNRQQNVVNMQQNVFYISVFCLRTQQLRVNYIEISFLYAELMDGRGAYLTCQIFQDDVLNTS